MTRTATTLLLFVIAAAVVAAGQRPPTRTFDDDDAGALPKGFQLGAMRQEGPGTWLVRRDGTNGYLAHTSDEGGQGYALALTPDEPLRDVAISARLRLNGGSRAGGLIWRHQDDANFHAAVLDLARGAVFLYLFRNGNRITLESRDDLELDPGGWHTLRVVHERASVYVAIGGIRVFEERDGRLERTFGPGRVGVLAAGDADVWFDDLRIEPERSRR